MWVVFNEGWGQYDGTVRLTKRVKQLDPSRLVNNASGWNDTGVGDVVDMHKYPGPDSPKPEPTRAAVLGEFGASWGYYPGHMWSRPGFTYTATPSPEEMTNNVGNLLRRAYALKDAPGLSAYVYTEITDVETEQAGFLTYDRAVYKMDPVRVALYNKGEFPPALPVTMLVPTSEAAATSWRYTLTQPAAGWTSVVFDDAGWTAGSGAFGQIPGSTLVRTPWTGSDIWLRRTFTLGDITGVPVLRMFHDEDVEVYINGVLAFQEPGFTTRYWTYELTPEARAALHAGDNVMAIHCRNTGGGQVIDAGLGVRPGS
jgi:hypothetical protein